MKSSIARAYDALAPAYDQQLAGDSWVRHQLWAHYRRIFRPGQHVLDVACGTGLDALFLAQHGIRVTGLDISPGMLAHFRAGIQAAGLQEQVTVVEGDVRLLETWPAASFDGMLSAFAGLNTVADLSRLSADASRLLSADGHFIVHMMNRFSVWEWLELVARGRWAAAGRVGRRERAFTIGEQTIVHHRYDPRDAYRRHFSTHFRLRECYGMGIFRPPPRRRIPRPLETVLTLVEQRLRSRWPFYRWGRFFVLDLQKR